MAREEQRTHLFALRYDKYKHNVPSKTKARKTPLSVMKDSSPELGFPFLCDSMHLQIFPDLLYVNQKDLGFEETVQMLIFNYCSVCINLSFVSDSEVLYLLPESIRL